MVDYKSMMKKVGLSNKGKRLTEEHKNKIRQWNKNNNWKPPVFKGTASPRWKGGRKILKGGYIGIYNPERQEYYPEHRLVMEKSVGRKLDRKEVVHHVNHNRQDNRLENLKLYATSGEHIMENHAKKDPSTGKFS